MALQRRQAQAQHLPGEGLAGQLGFDLAQATTLAQHQVADAALLALRKTRRVGMRQQVGAVAVVVVVRDHQAHLVQRTGPAQLAPRLGLGVGHDGVEQRQRHPRHALSLRGVDAKAALQLGHRGIAHIARQLTAQRQQAFLQIEQHALAQRALGRPKDVDAELRRQRVKDGQTARQDSAAVGLQARYVDAVDMAGRQAALDAPAQRCRGDAAVGPAGGQQQLRYRSGRA